VRYDLIAKGVLFLGILVVILYLAAEGLWYAGLHQFDALHDWGTSPQGIHQKCIFAVSLICVPIVYGISLKVSRKSDRPSH